MRGFGILAIVLGVIVMLGAMVMDISVPAGMGRVNNLGLMADRQNYTIIGGVLLIAGLLMAMLGRRNQGAPVVTLDSGTRPCPMCAETIKNAAIKCKHCGADIDAAKAPCPHSRQPRTSPGLCAITHINTVKHTSLRPCQ